MQPVRIFYYQKSSLIKTLEDRFVKQNKRYLSFFVRGGYKDDLYETTVYDLRKVKFIHETKLIKDICVICDDFFVIDIEDETYNTCSKLFVDFAKHQAIVCSYCTTIMTCVIGDEIIRLQERLDMRLCFCNMVEKFKKDTAFASIQEMIDFERQKTKST